VTGDVDRITAVLTQVDVAMAAARMARPDEPADAVKAALTLARDDLERMLSEGVWHPYRTPTRKDDDVRRRDLLRFGSLLTTAAVVPHDVLQRLAAALDRRTRVDAALLDGLAGATAAYARGYYVARPDDLLRVVRGHVNRLEALADESLEPGLRYRLGAVTSDAAALAGSLALDSRRRGEARAYFLLAQTAAREAGDATLYALAVASLGIMHSRSWGDDPGEARWHLSQAVGQLPEHAPDSIRAWLHAQLAKEEAAVGNTYGFYANMEHLDHARERNQAGEAVGAFWSDTGWFAYLNLPGWRDEYEGRGLAYLGHDEAGPTLHRGLAASSDPRKSATLNVALAEWHVARSEPEEAAYAAYVALADARTLPHWRGKVAAVRLSLEPWADLPEVRELDEALVLTAAG
jgi:hypothetical protein